MLFFYFSLINMHLIPLCVFFLLFVGIMRGRIIFVEGGSVMNGKKELGIVICSGSVLQVDHVTFRV